MSFFFETIAIPFWFIVFIFGSASPLWIKWYKNFIVTGVFLKKLKREKREKSVAEMKVDILRKATDNWNENSEAPGFSENNVQKKPRVKKSVDQVKKHNIKSVLKILAEHGEAGVLPRSISDIAGITNIDTKSALTYLIDKNYVEEINSTNGTKYYLTTLGRKYCINKKYIGS
ncbi:MAG: hypothetical protein KAT06_09475 [Gammaproteobacteria bacterium]|nr:hypothetical protein [Gammaproteobacteria bacterium]